jgi:uncharacterized protein with ParB-like and HNH nuclease domain
MDKSAELSSKIDANDITLAGILDRSKFTIDYFQREYRWENKHISQLIDDLSSAFLGKYDQSHDREEVENYNSYYMGPIVMSSNNGRLSIIDGQQRLTSLTLFLIYLNNRQKELPETEAIETLVFSEKYGKKSYNMQVEERETCFDSLFTKGDYSPADSEDESVLNLVERYNDIAELFPNEIDDKALPYFISWLKEKLIFVKIVTYSEENAYMIFETMNDRGLNLTPTEMLKGYLLSKVNSPVKKSELNDLWKEQIRKLHEWWQQEDLDFFKAWLRAKYADTIRPGRKGASNEDFEKIGTSFHTWIKDRLKLVGLHTEGDFIHFVENSFYFYTRLYLKIREAQDEQVKSLGNLYHIAWFGIADSLTYPLLVAPINEDDNEDIQNKKLQIVAHFLDCFAVYRAVNQRTLGQSSIRYTLYSLAKEIRNKAPEELVSTLQTKLIEQDEKLEGIKWFNLNQQNKRFVRYFLARLTQYIESESGINSDIYTYLSDSIGKPAQIEHIWADDYSLHKHELEQKTDFQWYRNSLGGLILLPKGTNQSFSSSPYVAKLPHYIKQNLLAQSLNSTCYEKNPNFTNWVRREGLNFKPHEEFTVEDLKERTELYQEIAGKVWSIESLAKFL